MDVREIRPGEPGSTIGASAGTRMPPPELLAGGRWSPATAGPEKNQPGFASSIRRSRICHIRASRDSGVRSEKLTVFVVVLPSGRRPVTMKREPDMLSMVAFSSVTPLSSRITKSDGGAAVRTVQTSVSTTDNKTCFMLPLLFLMPV